MNQCQIGKSYRILLLPYRNAVPALLEDADGTNPNPRQAPHAKTGPTARLAKYAQLSPFWCLVIIALFSLLLINISDPPLLSLLYIPQATLPNDMAYNNAIDEFREDEYPMMKGK